MLQFFWDAENEALRRTNFRAALIFLQGAEGKMIAILKNGTTQEQKEHLIRWLKNQNLDVHVSEGTQVTILGLVGDTSPGGHGAAAKPGHGGIREACHGALQAGQPKVPPQRHHCRGRAPPG